MCRYCRIVRVAVTMAKARTVVCPQIEMHITVELPCTAEFIRSGRGFFGVGFVLYVCVCESGIQPGQ